MRDTDDTTAHDRQNTMIKQTKAYRAALAQLADAIAQQNPVAIIHSLRAGEVTSDLIDVVDRRHPDFAAAMSAEVDEIFQRRKQAGIEKRRAMRAARR